MALLLLGPLLLMRMGVPEEYVQHQTKLATLTRTEPCGHPIWGYRGAQEGSMFATGGTHSCALWGGLIDIMAEMQHGMAKEEGVVMVGEWGRSGSC